MSLADLRYQQARRAALARLTIVCAVALALVGLARTALDDVAIAGASPRSEADEFYAWYTASERNAVWYHIRDEFGMGRLGDQAVHVATCESDLNPRARSATNDHGVFQLNAPSWQRRFAQVTGQAWNPNVYHASHNAAFARWLYEQSGWQPWACRP